ncbi:MAG: hypothetical protein ABSA17_00905 [Rhabdochlamydiaceae bacterium]|jgi:hypothetical protein
MKSKIPKKKAVKNMSKRSCGYWNCGYELRRAWLSKKFGFPEKKEAYEALKIREHLEWVSRPMVQVHQRG